MTAGDIISLVIGILVLAFGAALIETLIKGD